MENGNQEVSFEGSRASVDTKEANFISKQRRKFSLVSFPKTLMQSAVGPVVSLKNIRVTRESTGQLLVFLLKVAALEVVRRGSMSKCPQLWWGIQGISLLQAPALQWLTQWTPLRFLIQGSRIFSKPVLFLSLATAVSGVLDESRILEGGKTVEEQRAFEEERLAEGNVTVGTLALRPTTSEREQWVLQGIDSQARSILILKQELEKTGIILPERVNDDELERFLAVANGNIQRFFYLVKRTVRWRETFYFLTPQEVESWSQLVFWHGRDALLRPSLVIRLGYAYSTLRADERPSFAQAIVSQVEYGIMNLLNEDDPRITVIMDCKGTPAFGFPVNMMKSCCVLVQENYPTRLAALFVVNLPPVLRLITHAIIQDEHAEADQLLTHYRIQPKVFCWVQVLKAATRKKIHVEGDQCATSLAEHHGGTTYVPSFLGGDCTCSHCVRASTSHSSSSSQLLISNRDQGLHEEEDERNLDREIVDGEQYMTAYQAYYSVLRVVIVGFLMLWIIIAMIAGFDEPGQELLPT